MGCAGSAGCEGPFRCLFVAGCRGGRCRTLSSRDGWRTNECFRGCGCGWLVSLLRSKKSKASKGLLAFFVGMACFFVLSNFCYLPGRVLRAAEFRGLDWQLLTNGLKVHMLDFDPEAIFGGIDGRKSWLLVITPVMARDGQLTKVIS